MRRSIFAEPDTYQPLARRASAAARLLRTQPVQCQEVAGGDVQGKSPQTMISPQPLLGHWLCLGAAAVL